MSHIHVVWLPYTSADNYSEIGLLDRGDLAHHTQALVFLLVVLQEGKLIYTIFIIVIIMKLNLQQQYSSRGYYHILHKFITQ